MERIKRSDYITLIGHLLGKGEVNKNADQETDPHSLFLSAVAALGHPIICLAKGGEE